MLGTKDGKMKYAEIATTASQLTKLRDEHRKAATHFLTLFNKNRNKDRNSRADIHAPMSPLLSFYQKQTEYHVICAYALEAHIADYQHAVDGTILE